MRLPSKHLGFTNGPTRDPEGTRAQGLPSGDTGLDTGLDGQVAKVSAVQWERTGRENFQLMTAAGGLRGDSPKGSVGLASGGWKNFPPTKTRTHDAPTKLQIRDPSLSSMCLGGCDWVHLWENQWVSCPSITYPTGSE